jgi:ATP-dependent DNA helicase RecQ
VNRTPKQVTLENSYRQAANQAQAFQIVDCPTGPVLLVDDTVDSRWSFAVVGAQLRAAGVESVFPLALADTSRVSG